MNSAPFLVSCQFYFLSRALLFSCKRSLVLLSLFAGLAFWSLYTPALFSIIAMGFVVIAPKATLNYRMKALSLLCFLLVATPTLGKVIHHPDNAIGRHEAFLRGGEWQHQFDENYRPLPTYLNTLRDIGTHVLPSLKPFDRMGLLSINLEYSSMCLMLLGVAWGLVRLDRKRQLLLYGSTILLLAGIVLTNPTSSTWRELCLWTPLMIFAGLGLQFLLNAAGRVSSFLSGAVLTVILAVHVYFFGSHYLISRVGFFGDPMSDQVNVMYAGARPYLQSSRVTYLPNTGGGWFARLFVSLYPGKLSYRYYNSLTDLRARPSNALIVTLTGETDMPSASDVTEMLKSGKRFDFLARSIASVMSRRASPELPI